MHDSLVAQLVEHSKLIERSRVCFPAEESDFFSLLGQQHRTGQRHLYFHYSKISYK